MLQEQRDHPHASPAESGLTAASRPDPAACRDEMLLKRTGTTHTMPAETAQERARERAATIPARARDHLQRTRPPHEVSFTTRHQGGTRPKSEAPGGAQQHQDGPGHADVLDAVAAASAQKAQPE
jgi:hypothetical protein